MLTESGPSQQKNETNTLYALSEPDKSWTKSIHYHFFAKMISKFLSEVTLPPKIVQQKKKKDTNSKRLGSYKPPKKCGRENLIDKEMEDKTSLLPDFFAFRS